jgi:cytochrome b6-f complex iron-sulfur subunit
LTWLASLGALAGSYGLLGIYALRFLYPSHRKPIEREVFLALERDVGAGLRTTLPSGQEVVVTKTASGYLALSNVCPHLGCKVHWEAPRNCFFCPCHEGTFAADGTATGGPPKAEGKNLARYEITKRGDALYLKFQEV